MNCLSAIFNRLKLLKKRIASVRKPKWFQWSLTPKAGNPPTLSVLEAVVYLLVLCIGIWLFIQFNYIPHKSIFIEADRLSDYRYVKPNSMHLDSAYVLHYERATFNLRIPMTFAKKQKDSDMVTTLQGIIQSDSMYLKCIVVPNPFPDVISTRIMNLSPISTYWNIVFERAVRDNGMLPAPNYSVGEKYYDLRNSYYNKVSSYSRMKMMDSCILKLKQEVIPDSMGQELINNYRFVVKGQLDNKEFSYIEYPWHVTSDYWKTIQYDSDSLFTFRDIFAVKRVQKDNYIIKELYSRNNASLQRLKDLHKGEGDDHFIPDTIGTNFMIQPFMGEGGSIDAPGWLTLHDISQGYYDIELQTASIDSIQLTIDFVGAVNFWPSIEPDEKSGTYIKYFDPIKILKIRRDGLHLFYESKELANKQSIRVFAVTAFISGLFIIMLTFLIIGVYRAQRVLRELKKTNLNK